MKVALAKTVAGPATRVMVLGSALDVTKVVVNMPAPLVVPDEAVNVLFVPVAVRLTACPGTGLPKESRTRPVKITWATLLATVLSFGLATKEDMALLGDPATTANEREAEAAPAITL